MFTFAASSVERQKGENGKMAKPSVRVFVNMRIEAPRWPTRLLLVEK